MGAITDFFAASKGELAEAFRGWLTVADQPVKRDFKNPFTGKMQVIDVWPPSSPISDGPLVEFPDVRALPHCKFKRVDHVKLAKLDHLLCGRPFSDSIKAIGKPALFKHSSDNDCGLHEIPSQLVSAIAGMVDEKLKSTATDWAGGEEMRADRFSVDDCVVVLNSLRSVARVAIERNSAMYFYWSL